MLQIALWEPEIPPNTGNIARLCAATGCPLHLVGPLGFRIDEKSLRRAGLDYWDSVDLQRHDTLADFEKFVQDQGTRLFCLSGHVNKPGVYELPLGYPLKKLIYDVGGGIPGGKKLKAVVPGGSSTVLLNAEEAIGLTLSLSNNLDPEHSTAAIVLHHPETKYFAVRTAA